MLLLFLLYCIFLVYFFKTYSMSRRGAVLLAMIIYLLITLLDLGFLCKLGRPFHISDPSDYYYNTVNLTFSQLFKLEGTNTFYNIINWYYNHVFDNPYVISLFIKLDNILVILIAYLLITGELEDFGASDLILLFNPYLLVTISHNVRDAYIILFVSMVLVGMGCFRETGRKNLYLIIGLLLLCITRKILLVVFAIIALMALIRKNRRWIYVVVPVVGIVLFMFWNQIIAAMIKQAISAMEFVNEDTSDFAEMMENQYSISTLFLLFKRFGIGFVSLLLTPHPVNFFNQWIANADSMGTYGIYTAFDNVMIVIGAIYSYIFILPVLFEYFAEYKTNNQIVFYFILIFIVIYVIAYLGITDIRNRHIIFFFILADYIQQKKEFSLKTNGRYYMLSMIMFVFIALISGNYQ